MKAKLNLCQKNKKSAKNKNKNVVYEKTMPEILDCDDHNQIRNFFGSNTLYNEYKKLSDDPVSRVEIMSQLPIVHGLIKHMELENDGSGYKRSSESK